MRVFVTGAFGYLGLALLRRLHDRHEITAYGHAPRVEAARAVVPGDVRAVHGELAGAPRALADLGPFDAVVHLAGGGGPRKCEADPVAAVRVNVRETSELVAAARRSGVRRFAFASTIQVYGTFRDHGRPYREDDDARPDDLYGAVKHAAEHVVVAHGGGTALRIANIYGAGCGVDMGIQGAVERFARAAATGGEIVTFGTGSQRIDYVHVDDVVDAFARTLEADAPPPVVNVGSGAPVSIADLAAACARAGEARGRAPTRVQKEAPAGKVWPDRSLAIDLAAGALGWRPRVALADGIDELVGMMMESR